MHRALLLSSLVLAACTRPAAPTSGGLATIDHVVDGDTAVVQLNGREETIRLLGVDTPETVDPDTPPECFGAEASDHTKSLLPPGTEVRLTRDVEARDRYDRMDDFVSEMLDALADLDSSQPTLRRNVRAQCSVAVLPFADMSAARDQEYLCDGLAEEIVGALSRIGELRVASRTSAFQFKGQGHDIREIGWYKHH